MKTKTVFIGSERSPSSEKESPIRRTKSGVDVGLEGDCDCDSAVAVGTRSCGCTEIRRKELRSDARYVGVIRHARRCGTGDVD